MATSLYKCGDRNCYEEPIGSFFSLLHEVTNNQTKNKRPMKHTLLGGDKSISGHRLACLCLGQPAWAGLQKPPLPILNGFRTHNPNGPPKHCTEAH